MGNIQNNGKSPNNYNDNINQFNSIISKSAADALECDPDCQKKRHTEELKQKYEKAQDNVKYASVNEENAAKEYYTYTQGTSGYNKYQKEKITSQTKDLINNIALNFDEGIDSVKKLTETYDGLYNNLINSYELYDKYLNDNLNIENSIDEISTDRVTSDRKSFYEGQGIDVLNKWHVILKWIYLGLLVVFLFGILLSDSNYSFFTKIIIFIIFIIYPFVIYYIVMLCYYGIVKLYKLLPENAYTSI